jgi:hypothetical protein
MSGRGSGQRGCSGVRSPHAPTTTRLGGGRFADPGAVDHQKPADGWVAHLAADMTRNGAADLVSYLPAKDQWITTDVNPR